MVHNNSCFTLKTIIKAQIDRFTGNPPMPWVISKVGAGTPVPAFLVREPWCASTASKAMASTGGGC